MASPVDLATGDPQLTIGPAVGGTVGILNSVLKFGWGPSRFCFIACSDMLTSHSHHASCLSPSVKRIVITSSAASVTEPKDGPYVFTEVCCSLLFVPAHRISRGELWFHRKTGTTIVPFL